MRRFVMVVVGMVAMFAWTATASAGGWATANVSSTPAGIGPGEEWRTELKILQHGQTPLDGVEPGLIVRDMASGTEEHFAARPTGEPGVYAVTVTFPKAGRYEYSVDDGFGNAFGPHKFPPVTIGDTASAAAAVAPGGSDEGIPALPFLLAAAAVALAAAGAAAVSRLSPTRG